MQNRPLSFSNSTNGAQVSEMPLRVTDLSLFFTEKRLLCVSLVFGALFVASLVLQSPLWLLFLPLTSTSLALYYYKKVISGSTEP